MATSWGPHAPLGRAGEVYQNDLGVVDVPGVLQQLLGQFRAALAHGHGAESPVPGVGIGAQDHGAALRHLLSCIGVDDGLVGGDIDAAVLFRGGEAEDMVVLIDGAAHGAQAVVAVGQGVGDGELLHPGGPGLLDDAHIGDVVGHHSVKADLQARRIAGGVVGLENGPGHGALPPLLRRDRAGGSGDAARQEHAAVVKCNHIRRPPVCHGGAVFLPPNIPYHRPDEK